MPEHNTCLATTERLEEAVNRLTQDQNSLAQSHTSLSQAQSEMSNKIDFLIKRIAILSIPLSPHSPPTPPPQPSPPYCSHMKLDVPRFDGQDPLSWNLIILRVSTRPRQRTTHCRIILHGGPSPLLVPMDVAQRLPDVMVDDASCTGIPIHSLLL